MDKAVIFGVFDFVNFHICQTLLNQGIEVIGISFEEKEEIPNYEEKRLEVGRNANFIEQSFSDWHTAREEEQSKTVLVFSIYDWYMLQKETHILKKRVMKPIQDYIEKNPANVEIVILLPVQELEANTERQVEGFMKQLNQIVQDIHVFYLPSIYGPWQPESFLFQQAILSTIREANIQKAEREWTEDTLFVNDALESMFELIKSMKSGRYMLQSGKQNYWSECASYLQLDDRIIKAAIKGPVKIKRQVVTVPVQKITSIADSIAQQVDHVRRLHQTST
jgi:hypothetical protein